MAASDDGIEQDQVVLAQLGGQASSHILVLCDGRSGPAARQRLQQRHQERVAIARRARRSPLPGNPEGAVRRRLRQLFLDALQISG